MKGSRRLGLGRRRHRIASLRAIALLAAALGEAPGPYLNQALALAIEMDLPGEAEPIYAALGEAERAS